VAKLLKRKRWLPVSVSPTCANKSGKEKKKQAKEAEQKQTLLEQSAEKIAEMETVN
jgi:hypothetical protein